MELVGRVWNLWNRIGNMKDKEIIDEIIIQLNHFKFRRSSISYQYLIDAIYIVVKDRNVVRDFKKYVYLPIAQKYNTKSENVQWSLSKLIDLMYVNTSSDIIYEYFKFYLDEKPTLKYFIVTVARNVCENVNDEYIHY